MVTTGDKVAIVGTVRAVASDNVLVIVGGNGNHALRVAAADAVPFGPILREQGNPVRTVSATSATDVFSFTIPANTLLGSHVRARIEGDILQNSGGDQAGHFTIRAGSTDYHASSVTLANTASRYGFGLDLVVSYRTDGGQFLSGRADIGTAGDGSVGSETGSGRFTATDLAEDETAAITIAVRFHYTSSTTDSELRLYRGLATIE